MVTTAREKDAQRKALRDQIYHDEVYGKKDDPTVQHRIKENKTKLDHMDKEAREEYSAMPWAVGSNVGGRVVPIARFKTERAAQAHIAKYAKKGITYFLLKPQ